MIDQKKPDGYLAWHPEHGWEEYKHLRQKPDNPGLLNKLGDGWQIKPVWISEEPRSGWVSVKERLPEKPFPCLGYREIMQTYSVVFYSSTDRWMFMYEAEYASDITHWQPLSPPPL